MKQTKLLPFLLVFLAIALMSFNGTDTPREVADMAMKCWQKKDSKGYAECVLLAKNTPAERKKLADMMKFAWNGTKTIRSFKSVEEIIQKDRGLGRIIYQVTYTDGSSKKERVQLQRDRNGKWWIKL